MLTSLCAWRAAYKGNLVRQNARVPAAVPWLHPTRPGSCTGERARTGDGERVVVQAVVDEHDALVVARVLPVHVAAPRLHVVRRNLPRKVPARARAGFRQFRVLRLPYLRSVVHLAAPRPAGCTPPDPFQRT